MNHNRPIFETLVVTHEQNAEDLIQNMNLQAPALVANQGRAKTHRVLETTNGKIQILETTTRGVGINRNIALDNASANICLFGDDDVVYCDEYDSIVLQAFAKYPDADLIFFNLKSTDSDIYEIPHDSRVRFWNFLRFGTARVAFRLDPIRRNNLRFDERFGGGSTYLHGEDTIFFGHCLRAGLKVYAVNRTIGMLTNQRASTWNQGYTAQYVHDQGALYKAMSPRYWFLWALQDALRRCKRDYQMNFLTALRFMVKGAKTLNEK